MKPIRVLLVDDSGFARLLLADILSAEPDVEVIDTASNGHEAYLKACSLKPDVVVLDLIMEGYSGFYAIEQIMEHCPAPIIILSSAGSNNSETVVEALQKGVFAFVHKPKGAFHTKLRESGQELLTQIRLAVQTNIKLLLQKKTTPVNLPHVFTGHYPYQLIVIGGSTGATGAIESLLLHLPANIPIPIMIVQHMPESFINSFAQRLNSMVPMPVQVALSGMRVSGGQVYLAPGSTNIGLKKSTEGQLVIVDDKQMYPAYNFPSVDSLMLAAARELGSKTIAVLLSGMGKDGVAGMEAVYKAGGLTIAQDKESSILYGMPKAATDAGVVKQVLPLREIATYLVTSLS